MFTYIYIYIYIEREREIMCMCMYIYIYIYIDIYVYMHIVTSYQRFPTMCSLISKDGFLPRPCEDCCDNPCDDLLMYCVDTSKLSREAVAVCAGGVH